MFAESVKGFLDVYLIITDAGNSRTRSLQLSIAQIVAGVFLLTTILLLLAAILYQGVFLKGAREGWPVIGTIVRQVVQDEAIQRDRYVQENIDAMARRLGEMQAKLLQLESLGERVSGLAGMNVGDLRRAPGRGGVLLDGQPLTLSELGRQLTSLELQSNESDDLLARAEARLFEQKIQKSLIPTQAPVAGVDRGSSFGWRIDPMTGRSALHTGLDFPADVGTPIQAAAGGVVIAQEFHPAYGNMIDIDHGNDLTSRYAHASKVFVKKGDLVKRGQKIAEVGNTGRSTGPHLHFEVLVKGVQQDPQTFLAAGERLPAVASRQAAIIGR